MNVLVVLKSGLSDDATDGLTCWLSNVMPWLAKSVGRIDLLSPARKITAFLGELQPFCRRFSIVDEQLYKTRYFHLFRGWDSAALNTFKPEMSRTIAEWTSETCYDLALFCGHGAHSYLDHVRATHRMVVPLDAPGGLIGHRPVGILASLKSHANRHLLRSSQKLYNRADSVLVVSDADAALLRSAGVSVPIVVIPLSVDTEYFHCERPHATPRPSLLFTGVLDFPPNVDAALHLVSDIFVKQGLQDRSILCTIAGRRPTEEVRRLGAAAGVRVIADAQDLRPLFSESLIYVAPMRTGLGMKTKVLEALAMSKPVVAYPLALNGFRLPVPGVLCGETPAELARHLRRLSGDRERCRHLGAEGRRYVERHHGPEAMVARLLEYSKRCGRMVP